MKKRFFVLTAALLMTLSAIFAKDTKPVPAAIVNQLHQKFDNASNIQWETTSNYYEAKFILYGHPLKAFYSFDGEMIGMSRVINIGQLPMALLKEVKEKTSTSTVTDLFELLTDRGTEYFITYKNDKGTVTY